MPEQVLSYDQFSTLRQELTDYAAGRVNLSPNAIKVFGEVYLKDTEKGTRETVAERMAAISLDIASAAIKYFPKDLPPEQGIARVREGAQRNLEMYLTNTFRPNTPTNINFGRWTAVYNERGDVMGYKMKDQLGSACFVLPVEDTFGEDVSNLEDGILEAWVVQQLVHKGGGGTGFGFQNLRPKGSVIGYNPAVDGMKSISWDGTRGVASGYESFLHDFYNQATEAVKQGNTRRGANMGIQRIDHMDFLDHMFAKYGDRQRSEFRMKNFNLSLAVTDEFMESALKGETYTLFNPHRANPRIRKVLEEKFGIEHPEIVRKGDLATKAQFLEILKKNSKNLFAPITTPNMYISDDGTTVINAYTGEEIGTVVDDIVRISARKILDTHALLSHSNGEPGMVFIDRMNEYNPIFEDEEYEATNPCGEQPLPRYGACNLGSINVGAFVRNALIDSTNGKDLERLTQDKFSVIHHRADGKIGVSWVDWDSLRATIRDGIVFLDNVIERSDFPAAKIRRAVENGRNIGLGYMGVADTMALLKIRYGSERSLEFAEELGKVLDEESLVASQQLAEDRGEFPLWEKSLHNPASKLFEWYSQKGKKIRDKFRGERKLSDKVDRSRVINYGKGKIRNSCRMTQAPTGTIRRSVGQSDSESGLENLAISSGIEPVYSLLEGSNILNAELQDVSFGLVELLKREGLPVKEIVDAVRKNRGSVFVYKSTPAEAVAVLEKLPKDVRDVLVSAAGGEDGSYEITPEQHVRMATTFQRYNDSAISKTTNLPSSATPEDTRQTWIDLWQAGSKGGTVYVDKSRKFQILNVIDETKGLEGKINGKKTKRPLLQRSITLELPYITSKPREGTGELDFDPESCFTTLTFNLVNGHLTGVFQNIAEGDPERISLLTSANIELSRTLKEGRPLDKVIKDLEKVSLIGNRSGIVVDEAVMNGSLDRLRYQVGGSTTRGGLLDALYVARFLTDNGAKFNSEFIEERLRSYELGEITLRSIINTQGNIKIERDSGAMPSILGSRKVIKAPEGISGKLCPECG